jgi:hypothetical protein
VLATVRVLNSDVSFNVVEAAHDLPYIEEPNSVDTPMVLTNRESPKRVE